MYVIVIYENETVTENSGLWKVCFYEIGLILE